MNVLIIGCGGREHCLAWKISESPRVKKIYASPGNAGIARLAECAEISPWEIDRLAGFCKAKKIDLAVIGPEAPLALGITDVLKEEGIRAFGPSRKAAMLESSKVFCKRFLKKHGIPSAASEDFDDMQKALSYLKSAAYPLVVKADGLCAGKGVSVCSSRDEAAKAVRDMMGSRVFGEAGCRLLIEDYLQGEEASFMVISDGSNFAPLLPSQDHKTAYAGDKGPNTGGMGAYAPTLILNSGPRQFIIDNIIKPVISSMGGDGSPFKGVLYAGLILTENGPKVLEFNARFGDPETQAVLPLLQTDIMELLEGSVEGGLGKLQPSWRNETAVCVVMASEGYPGKYETGEKITGIPGAEAKGALVFHAGTRRKGNDILTAGGRVLGVTARAASLQESIDKTYSAVREIKFEGAFYREDIGWKALKHSGEK